jgi:hypothetical protein
MSKEICDKLRKIVIQFADPNLNIRQAASNVFYEFITSNNIDIRDITVSFNITVPMDEIGRRGQEEIMRRLEEFSCGDGAIFRSRDEKIKELEEKIVILKKKIEDQQIFEETLKDKNKQLSGYMDKASKTIKNRWIDDELVFLIEKYISFNGNVETMEINIGDDIMWGDKGKIYENICKELLENFGFIRSVGTLKQKMNSFKKTQKTGYWSKRVKEAMKAKGLI